MAQNTFDWSIDLISKAEQTIEGLSYGKIVDKTDEVFDVKYTQVRKILSSVVAIKNKLGVEQRKTNEYKVLPKNIALEVKFLKTTFLYQAGRDKNKKYPVMKFIKDTQLTEMVDSIGNSVEKFDLLCKYVEALVAFYKYRAVSLIIENKSAKMNKNNKSSSNKFFSQSNRY